MAAAADAEARRLRTELTQAQARAARAENSCETKTAAATEAARAAAAVEAEAKRLRTELGQTQSRLSKAEAALAEKTQQYKQACLLNGLAHEDELPMQSGKLLTQSPWMIPRGVDAGSGATARAAGALRASRARWATRFEPPRAASHSPHSCPARSTHRRSGRRGSARKRHPARRRGRPRAGGRRAAGGKEEGRRGYEWVLANGSLDSSA